MKQAFADDLKLDCVNLSPHIGTDVRRLDLNQPLDQATIDALQKVWLERALLIFRGQATPPGASRPEGGV